MTDAERPDERAEGAEGAEGAREAEDSSPQTEASAVDEAASAEPGGAPEGETAPDATSAGEDAATAADDETTPEPSDEDQPPPEAAASDEQPPAPERRETERRRDRSKDESPAGAEAIPGAHLEPDLVLEEESEAEEPDYSRYAAIEPEAELEEEAAEAGDVTAEHEPTDREAPAPAPRSALDLAADARYYATGKRKTSVARVILKPGSGGYTVNGRPLDSFFPRTTLQLAAREPLQSVGYEERMDVVARLHGGGVSSQAGALRHGIARALVEADPALRGELKRRGFLTRDARAKERRKAGLKKARKRPQFSKR